MKILVTGATGFAGSHLVELLLKDAGVEVFGTTFSKGSESAFGLDAEHLISVDLTNAPATDAMVARIQPDQIYHLAAFAFVGKSFERAEEVLENNSKVQLHMLEAVRARAPRARMLSIGSAEEYGFSEPGELPIKETHSFRPINPYAVSKVTQEMLALAYQKSFALDVVRVRPFNHIGERQSAEFAIPSFVKQIVAVERGNQQVMTVGSLHAVRDFTDVKDMVSGYVAVMNRGQSGEVYNLGSGIGVSMQRVVELLQEISKRDIVLETDVSKVRPFDVPEIIADIAKAKRLGWTPSIPLKESLQRVLEYWRGL